MRPAYVVTLLPLCFAPAPRCEAGEPFVREADILVVARDGPASALEARVPKQEVVLTEVVAALTTFTRVGRDQYLVYDHRGIAARGSVTFSAARSQRSSEPDPAIPG
jgi:hypothetical protein